MGDRSAATDKVYVTTKVLNLAHQGMELPLVAASIAADNAEFPVIVPEGELPSVTASSRLMWDISKNGPTLAEGTGWTHGPTTMQCVHDTTRLCKRTVYSVMFSAPAGGKGAMPAVGDVTFVDDLSPESMYPQLTPEQHALMNAELDKYGSVIQLSTWSSFSRQATPTTSKS